MEPERSITKARLRGGLWVVVLGVGGGTTLINRSRLLAASPAAGQHIGILLVEFGVGLTVTTVMLLLFHAFAGFSPRAFDAVDAEEQG